MVHAEVHGARVKALVCNVLCRDGFKADRRARLIYQSTRIVFPTGKARTVGVEVASNCFGECAYCGARIRDPWPAEKIQEATR